MRHNLRLYAFVPHFFALCYRVTTSYIPPGRLEGFVAVLFIRLSNAMLPRQKSRTTSRRP